MGDKVNSVIDRDTKGDGGHHDGDGVQGHISQALHGDNEPDGNDVSRERQQCQGGGAPQHRQDKGYEDCSEERAAFLAFDDLAVGLLNGLDRSLHGYLPAFRRGLFGLGFNSLEHGDIFTGWQVLCAEDKPAFLPGSVVKGIQQGEVFPDFRLVELVQHDGSPEACRGECCKSGEVALYDFIRSLDESAQ